MKFCLSLFIFLSISSYAQKAELTILDENIKDTQGLEKNFNIHRGSTHQSSIPSKDSRNNLLKKLEASNNWDELKKDIFFMDLKALDLNSLEKKYPEVSLKDLEILKEKRK